MTTPLTGDQWVAGITLVCVLLVLLKVYDVKLPSVSVETKKEPYLVTSPSVLAYNTVDDAGNRSGYYPADHGREGMGGSMSAGEAPVWHQTAHDPTELDMVSYERAARDADRVLYNPENVAGTLIRPTNADVQSVGDKWRDGMAGYGRIRQGMTSMQTKLEAAMQGVGTSL